MPTRDELLGFVLNGLVHRWLTLSQACEIADLSPMDMGLLLGGYYRQMMEEEKVA